MWRWASHSYADDTTTLCKLVYGAQRLWWRQTIAIQVTIMFAQIAPLKRRGSKVCANLCVCKWQNLPHAPLSRRRVILPAGIYTCLAKSLKAPPSCWPTPSFGISNKYSKFYSYCNIYRDVYSGVSYWHTTSSVNSHYDRWSFFL